MEAIESLKNEGNRKFVSGNVSGAIDDYISAGTSLAELLKTANTPASTIESGKKLQVVIFSNLANAYLSIGEFSKSVQAAQEACKVDETALKAWMRFVEARRRDGYPFDAFVCHLRHVRPLLRAARENGQVSAKEASELLSLAEGDLFEALGLSRVSHDIELVEYAGGVDMVSRRAFGANEVVFVEKKYKTNFDEESLNLGRDLTTVKMVEHFAKHLRPEQETNSERWQHLKKQFSGAWPRSLDAIDAETQSTVRDALVEIFPDVNVTSLNELLVSSLMCRYNCFHSGFFRACALANHSCQANIAMKYNSADETVTMITVSPVQPGERMNVKYLSDAHFLMGLGQRRTYLRSWLFWCLCPRCIADNAPDAVHEQLRCRECGKLTHCPLRGDSTEEDPLLAEQIDKPCTSCGASLAWSEDCGAKLRVIVPHFMESTTLESGKELGDWCQKRLVGLRELPLHPMHWAYRVLLYFVCVPLTTLVHQCVEPLRHAGMQVSYEDMKELFSPYGLNTSYIPQLSQLHKVREGPEGAALLTDPLVHAEDAGCEALRVIEVLWHLISTFYPAHEMWAIHKAACQLVLVHLLLEPAVLGPTPTAGASGRSGNSTPQSPPRGHLSVEKALLLLHRHGPYIGDLEAGKWMHTYTLRKGLVTDTKGLPPVSRIKKAFKG